jgi:dipeptidyl aminopeptidase/acylaminoacyl peptidase
MTDRNHWGFMTCLRFCFFLLLCSISHLISAATLLQRKEQVLFYPSGALRIMARAYFASNSEVSAQPIILFNHGGIAGLNDNAQARCRELRDQGFVVFASSYRGEDRSEGQIEIALGEVTDVLAGLAWLDHNAQEFNADTSRVALVGFSHGALIGLQAAKQSARFKSMVFAYGVSDIYQWTDYLRATKQMGTDPLSRRIYGTGPKSRPDQYRKRFGLLNLHQLQPSIEVLILQGARDVIVPLEQANRLASALKTQNIRHQLLIYPHAEHGFLIRREALHGAEKRESDLAWGEISAFLARTLATQ